MFIIKIVSIYIDFKFSMGDLNINQRFAHFQSASHARRPTSIVSLINNRDEKDHMEKAL